MKKKKPFYVKVFNFVQQINKIASEVNEKNDTIIRIT